MTPDTAEIIRLNIALSLRGFFARRFLATRAIISDYATPTLMISCISFTLRRHAGFIFAAAADSCRSHQDGDAQPAA